MKRRHFYGWLALLYTLAVFGLAWHNWAGSTTQPRLQLQIGATIRAAFQQGGRVALINIVGNVTAFAPSGWLLAFWRPKMRLWQIGIIGIGLSCTVELGQYWLGYRVVDIDDVVLNSLGFSLAGSVARASQRLIQRCTREADRGDSS